MKYNLKKYIKVIQNNMQLKLFQSIHQQHRTPR